MIRVLFNLLYKNISSRAVKKSGKLCIFTSCQIFMCATMLLVTSTTRAQSGTIFVDPEFNPGKGVAGLNQWVHTLAVQPKDEKIIIGGSFDSVDGIPRKGIARLNADGSLDVDFIPGDVNEVRAIALQSDGRIIIGGQFTDINGTQRKAIARLNADGSLDTSYEVDIREIYPFIYSVTLQPDGKAIISGIFSTVEDIKIEGIARVNVDGSLDKTFAPPFLSPPIYTVAVQSDGKLLIGGDFGRVNDQPTHSGIVRLNSDGSIDTTFNAGSLFPTSVRSIAIQPDGRIVIAGGFESVDGVSRNRIARINSDGSLDASFDPGAGAEGGYPQNIALQPDGKVLLSGDFNIVSGKSRNNIARLHTDGTLDNTFDPGEGADSVVSVVTLQSDGNALIGGLFTSFNGTTRNRIARLLMNLSTTMIVTPSVPGGHGAISPASAQSVTSGDSVSFTLEPANGYVVDTVDGSCGGTLNGNTFITAPVFMDCNVFARFKLAASPSSVHPVPMLAPAALAGLIAAMGLIGALRRRIA
ncbi:MULTISPECIES: hypothetical protein [unclassified Delftia]|uniref:hypothetical protein n=1 Tax=unclassified Delftia TaxID=2613839 RepID=UPI0009DF02F1|nr:MULTISPECIES: hypothetical protein [unclassified Delftia]MDC2862353.1 hypothetical protein [Delftia sp. DT-2]